MRSAPRAGQPAAPRRRRAVILTLVAALAAPACAGRFTPPVGPGQPLSPASAQTIWQNAIAECAIVRSYNAEIRPSGRVADARIRGVRLLVALDEHGRIALEAEATGPPVFTLRGDADAATLWLPRENRVITDRPDAILGALVGLDVGPARLLSVMAGCVAAERTLVRAEQLDGVIRVTTPDSVVYLVEDEGRWAPRAGEFGAFVADYRDREGVWPKTIAIQSRAGHAPAVQLELAVSYHVLNADLPAAAFAVSVPPGAVPASVENLRPLGSD